MNELILFASTFTVVFALGFQQQNVVGAHYLAAFLTSFVIGGSYLFLYKLVPGAGPSEIAAYLAGGPLGIVASMYVHRRTVGRQRLTSSVAQALLREMAKRAEHGSGAGSQPQRDDKH